MQIAPSIVYKTDCVSAVSINSFWNLNTRELILCHCHSICMHLPAVWNALANTRVHQNSMVKNKVSDLMLSGFSLCSFRYWRKKC